MESRRWAGEIWKEAWPKVLGVIAAVSALVGLTPVWQWLVTLPPHHMAALLSLLAGVVTILSLVVWILVRSRGRPHPAGDAADNFGPTPTRPARSVENERRLEEPRPEGDVGLIEALTWSDAVHAMSVLADRIRDFRPDLVIGIDRGGSIVAGVLAKALGIPSSTIAIQSQWTLSTSEGSLDDGLKNPAVAKKPLSKIIVVDDVCREGGTLKASADTLQRLCETSEIRTAVILNVSAEVGPSRADRPRGKFNPYYFFYSTSNRNCRPPWDRPRR